MATLLTTITTIFQSIISWVGSVMGMITAEGNEILLLAVILPIALISIGVVRRLLRL